MLTWYLQSCAANRDMQRKDIIMKPAVLFKNIHLLSAQPDPEQPWLSMPDMFVAIKEGVITCVSKKEKTAAATLQGTAYETYNGRHKLLLPALANLHGHIP